MHLCFLSARFLCFVCRFSCHDSTRFFHILCISLHNNFSFFSILAGILSSLVSSIFLPSVVCFSSVILCFARRIFAALRCLSTFSVFIGHTCTHLSRYRSTFISFNFSFFVSYTDTRLLLYCSVSLPFHFSLLIRHVCP